MRLQGLGRRSFWLGWDRTAQWCQTTAQVGLHLGHGIRIDSTGRVKTKFRRAKNDAHGWRCGLGIGNNVARHLLKHPVNHADVEVVHLRCCERAGHLLLT